MIVVSRCFDEACSFLPSGGITYIALASIYLAPPEYSRYRLTPSQMNATIRCLVTNQKEGGGFSGRTNKPADTCYCFWCGGALKVRDPAFTLASELTLFPSFRNPDTRRR